MNISILIAVLCILISTICSIYILKTKNLSIIASIEIKKVPRNKVNTLISLFVTCLMISTCFTSSAIIFLDYNFCGSLILLGLGLITIFVFYVYYLKIKLK